jgi:hypothetical protein
MVLSFQEPQAHQELQDYQASDLSKDLVELLDVMPVKLD